MGKKEVLKYNSVRSARKCGGIVHVGREIILTRCTHMPFLITISIWGMTASKRWCLPADYSLDMRRQTRALAGCKKA